MPEFNDINVVETGGDGDREVVFLVSNTGKLYGYGFNYLNILGATLGRRVPTTEYIEFNLPEIIDVQIGGTIVNFNSVFVTALDTSGNVWAWGGNSIGQLGTGSTETKSTQNLVLTRIDQE
jgi:alpha-tubulin suppressor-like RCC1 family protein